MKSKTHNDDDIYTCNHCGAVFRVVLIGVHKPKTPAMHCPFCGSDKAVSKIEAVRSNLTQDIQVN